MAQIVVLFPELLDGAERRHYWHWAGAVMRVAGDVAEIMPDAVARDRLGRLDTLAMRAKVNRDWGLYDAIAGARRDLHVALFNAQTWRRLNATRDIAAHT